MARRRGLCSRVPKLPAAEIARSVPPQGVPHTTLFLCVVRVQAPHEPRTARSRTRAEDVHVRRLVGRAVLLRHVHILPHPRGRHVRPPASLLLRGRAALVYECPFPPGGGRARAAAPLGARLVAPAGSALQGEKTLPHGAQSLPRVLEPATTTAAQSQPPPKSPFPQCRNATPSLDSPHRAR